MNKLNTSYYKFELLNSICSAINNGISPSDIFILDHSLPLYNRYANLNLLEDTSLVKSLYEIGLPIPLAPTQGGYDLNLLYQAFRTVNSFLYKNHVRPLTKDSLVEAYEVLKSISLSEAEEHIVSLAAERAERSVEAAAKRGEKKEPINWDDIDSSLKKYHKKKDQLLIDLTYIDQSTDKEKDLILEGVGRESQRLSSILISFFHNFNVITRPLVIARVSEKNSGCSGDLW